MNWGLWKAVLILTGNADLREDIGLRGGEAQKVRALGGGWQDLVLRGDIVSSPHLVSCS